MSDDSGPDIIAKAIAAIKDEDKVAKAISTIKNAIQESDRLCEMKAADLKKDNLRKVARAAEHFFNGDKKGNDRQFGFVFMLFSYGDDSGDCKFITNGAGPKLIVTLMKNVIARFEHAEDDPL